MAHRRHPLLGDSTYGGRLRLPRGASEELVQALRDFRRQALHATRLAFRHPVSGDAVEVQSDPPADFAELLETLGADLRS
jgi:23S rRNA pseudouridine1911/1915/1917 synthase